MSLKSDYYDGLTGLHQKLRDAFNAGIAFIGSGTLEVSSLDLGDRNGAALDQVGAVAGLYWDVSSPSTDFRVWYKVDTEVAPTAGGRTLVLVGVLSSDTRAEVAAKTMIALNQLSGTPFECVMVGDSILITCTVAGNTTPISLGTLGGTAVVDVVTEGSVATGNYITLQNSLKDAAAQGKTKFVVSLASNFQSGYIRANNGDNLLKKAYFAGITQALADAEIYNYECELKLNVSDSTATRIDLNFNFQTT